MEHFFSQHQALHQAPRVYVRQSFPIWVSERNYVYQKWKQKNWLKLPSQMGSFVFSFFSRSHPDLPRYPRHLGLGYCCAILRLSTVWLTSQLLQFQEPYLCSILEERKGEGLEVSAHKDLCVLLGRLATFKDAALSIGIGIGSFYRENLLKKIRNQHLFV